MQSQIEYLNARFAIEGHVYFDSEPEGLVAAVIENNCASARMTLAGGHVMRYSPRGQDGTPGTPVLWVSPNAHYIVGKAMRGGAPICWPWFGPHPTDPERHPLHGLVRQMLWDVTGTRALADGATEVAMRTAATPQTLEQWPHTFELEIRAVFGAQLLLEWTVRNTGSEPFCYTGAIHPYYVVSDAYDISIHGLENTDYMDKNANFERKTQPGSPIRVDGPIDRVYIDTVNEVVIDDPGLRRKLHISKTGSRTTVVWNPYHADALMDDVGKGQHRNFVCAEAANALEDAVTVAPGAEARMSMQIWSEEYEP